MLYAPHTSAGRLPTDKGMRFFVDGLLEFGRLTKEEREEYRIYLMEQENETKYMLWNEWKLSKVFKKTLTQLDKKNGR